MESNSSKDFGRNPKAVSSFDEGGAELEERDLRNVDKQAHN
jgi:hypothetical protein